tara:strand:- start:14 stop:793 length:780 start_codon:yes stop_codon:yes gene_type:complete
MFLLLLSLISITSVFNTGCVLYPVEVTCFENFKWAIKSSEVIDMNNWYELWSKGGAAPNFRVDNPSEYILFFNWVPNWLNIYFFNKVSDFLLGLILMIIIFCIVFYSKKKKESLKRKNFFIFFILLCLVAEWFYNHPALRYGGYSLIAGILFLSFSQILEKNSLRTKELKKKAFVLVTIAFLVFTIRNGIRINNEIDKYSYKPLKNFSYKIDESHFRIDKEFKSLIKNFEDCENNLKTCDKNLKNKVEKFHDKIIFITN